MLAMLLLVPGCWAAPQRAGAGVTHDPRATVRRPSDLLDADEIRTARTNDAYEAVVHFRPEFLRQHDTPLSTDPTAGYPVVYLNGVRQGSTHTLRTIPAAVIIEIRYLPAGVASDQFGTYYPGGVIAVRTSP